MPVFTISLAGLYWKKNLATDSTLGLVLEWGWELLTLRVPQIIWEQVLPMTFFLVLVTGYHMIGVSSGLPVLFNRSK